MTGIAAERVGVVIDILSDIRRLSGTRLLSRLLRDKATKGNILWATDDYLYLGDGYGRGNEIRPEQIAFENFDLIKTRARREAKQRTERTRRHAEVFTPLWIVKKMCDAADEEWFGGEDGSPKTDGAVRRRFAEERTWKKYADARRLEITCGEAPFLVTRYDTETGEEIPVEDRIGFLDRKLRAVSENAADVDEWKRWAFRAVQSVYGYELQGDNLLIARVNVLCSVEEHMVHRWRQEPDKAWLEKLCTVICWNLWQMDGIKGCVPAEPQPSEEQLSLFLSEPQNEQGNLFGEKEEKKIDCRLFDWREKQSISYKALREKGPELMKFDFIIGNPPYQEETESDSTRKPPIYNNFMDEAYLIGSKVELITPARFLFNAGYTPKAWNEKMLNDEHFQILFYEPDSYKVFSGVEIKGGIAVSYRDENKSFGAIETFTKYKELNTILKKVKAVSKHYIDTIISATLSFKLSPLMLQEHPNTVGRLRTSAFTNLAEIFFEEQPNDGFEYVSMIGMLNGKRVKRFVRRDYLVDGSGTLDKYTLLVPNASGNGEFGEKLSGFEIAEPGVAFSQTFNAFGCSDTKDAVINIGKYIKTKFARALLGVLKITQHLPAPKWKYVPLQDFSPASDIDWTKSVAEIDKQLYAKYGLDDAEIEFIESHVKEMT